MEIKYSEEVLESEWEQKSAKILYFVWEIWYNLLSQ